MWDTIKDLLITRGPQLIARYTGMALVSLGTYIGATAKPEDIGVTANLIATFGIAGICAIVDHFLHAKIEEVK